MVKAFLLIFGKTQGNHSKIENYVLIFAILPIKINN